MGVRPDDVKPIPMGLKFAFGGLSGAGAACVVQTMDLVKNRMQVKLEPAGTDGFSGTVRNSKFFLRFPVKAAEFVYIIIPFIVHKLLLELKVF